MQIVRRLSSTISKRVLGDASSTQCRWRSFAVTVPSDSAADRRKQKRVSMEERIEMVEGFVNKYRAMNGGKFPSTKMAMKEVGGSFYTVKKIVQEMQYNAKMPVDKDTVVKEASARKAAIRKDNLLSKVEETLSSATSLGHEEECEDGQLTNEILLEKEFNQNWKPSHELKEIPSDRQTVDGGISQETQSLCGVEGGDTNSYREAEAKLQTPIAAEQILLQEMSRISGSDNKDDDAQLLESKVKSFSRSEEPENNIKQKHSPVEDFKLDGLKQMDEQRHSPEPEKPTRELSNEHKADTQAESKPSMWKNMKSFADGILSMWWKQ
ncbi:uncharacterized protein LOC129896425 [Solanum dulcamara]|uniref:uncharacterized protein LOC129896425 n=1 Tax=Solanum dulcamara TaxID=45834 RepID=UPI002485AAD1|nr:uncharacterized protein LOC129896425 [Solanum dulcamara]XP_055828301.1 uncharacterized protein LOC129896425 [Solanum dulcamara]XP_055828302.1 uncharacterized protein LOC129896425 [Solanum dulcamara]